MSKRYQLGDKIHLFIISFKYKNLQRIRIKTYKIAKHPLMLFFMWTKKNLMKFKIFKTPLANLMRNGSDFTVYINTGQVNIKR